MTYKRPEITICGLLYCYNEEHIIAETLEYYLSQGIDIVAFDNYSNDSSLKIIEGLRDGNGRYPGIIKDIVRVKTNGYEWSKILKASNEYMHKRLSNYDWIEADNALSIHQNRPTPGRFFLPSLSRH